MKVEQHIEIYDQNDIYITCDTSIAHYSTWQFSVETFKTVTYDTHTIYYSLKYDSHLQIHMYIDT